MRPFHYVLGLEILFPVAILICLPFGIDITGNNSHENTMNNSTHVEISTTSTKSIPKIEVSTTVSSLNIYERITRGHIDTLCFCFYRVCMFCLKWRSYSYANYKLLSWFQMYVGWLGVCFTSITRKKPRKESVRWKTKMMWKTKTAHHITYDQWSLNLRSKMIFLNWTEYTYIWC